MYILAANYFRDFSFEFSYFKESITVYVSNGMSGIHSSPYIL